MNQTYYLKYFCLAIFFGVFSCTEKETPPPNVVIIFTDDQGYSDVGVFGAKGFETPNLDQMASDGIRRNEVH